MLRTEIIIPWKKRSPLVAYTSNILEGSFWLTAVVVCLFFRGYLVVMPKVFRPDVDEVLSVTILKPTEPIYVEAKLFSKTGHLLAESGHQIFGTDYLTLSGTHAGTLLIKRKRTTTHALVND